MRRQIQQQEQTSSRLHETWNVREYMAGIETQKCEEKSTEICNDWETPTYRKEVQSGYDSHPAQAKTWMLLVQHHGTTLSIHMTAESELKKIPQTSLACEITWKIRGEMCVLCQNPKIISSNSTARCQLPDRCQWHSRSVNPAESLRQEE